MKSKTGARLWLVSLFSIWMLTICNYMHQKPNNSKKVMLGHSKNTTLTSVCECHYPGVDDSDIWYGRSTTATASAGASKAKPGVGKSQGGTSATNTSNNNAVFTFDNFPAKTMTCEKWKAGKCNAVDKCRFRHSDDVRIILYITLNLIHVNRCVTGPG